MNQAPIGLTSMAANGPLRRNQACHQCRARKLKCDAGRPCSTCKRSHAKAIASLKAAGKPVFADPNCTYDYAPGEDPWKLTVRGGSGLNSTRGSPGSASPANSANDAHGGYRDYARNSPHYPSSTSAVSYPSASTSSLAPVHPTHPAYQWPPYPPAQHPGSDALLSDYSYPLPLDSLDENEMANMLYSQAEMDPSDSLFLPHPSYTDPYLQLLPSGSNAPLYAQNPAAALPHNLAQFYPMSPLELGESQFVDTHERTRGSTSPQSRSSHSSHHRHQ